MIGTLIAQEWRATRKWLLATVGIALLAAAVSLVPGLMRVPILSEFGYVVAIIAIALITPTVLGLLVENYWRTMHGREGYFTMTLPVRGRTIFTAKVLYGALVALIGVVLTLAGVLGVSLVLITAQGGDVQAQAQAALAVFDGPMIWFLVCAVVVQALVAVMAGAAAMSVGATARFNHLGFGAPVLGIVFFYLALQFVDLLAMLFVPLGIRVDAAGGSEFVAQGTLDDFVQALGDLSAAAPEPQSVVIGLGMVFVNLAAVILLAWWGSRSVDRHISLR
ncbi:hypothetical protein G7067_04190 [Leucobacter insecticola]|uniref:Uncharacterized protein n=1 Tax=Leucobacter insecticola TaxID=2714934 RepID=A0A6G8FH16_9MICO|nr:hypothetical protein [Leucobacter insecticola]QIM15796.1 hypothetical protein G7067_04190 [Leucobacter insecticola]